jgi:uncharacterized membrane protein YqhA
MRNLKIFIKTKLPIFLIKLIVIYLFCYLFMIVMLNYFEIFLVNLDISSILSNYKEEFLRFLSSDEIKSQIKTIINFSKQP